MFIETPTVPEDVGALCVCVGLINTGNEPVLSESLSVMLTYMDETAIGWYYNVYYIFHGVCLYDLEFIGWLMQYNASVCILTQCDASHECQACFVPGS